MRAVGRDTGGRIRWVPNAISVAICAPADGNVRFADGDFQLASLI